MKTHNKPNRFVRAIKKFLLSAFLIISFGAYALEHGDKGSGLAQAPARGALAAEQAPVSTAVSTPIGAASAATEEPAAAATAGATAAPTAEPSAAPTAEPAAEATATSAPAPTASSGLKDGTYTGPSVDVRWGLVQVQATVRGGKISNVQFLQYPSDRRTSQRINSQANPWLEQEAIQAQSANVDLISGATLTSEGFAESLQGALDQAQG